MTRREMLLRSATGAATSATIPAFLGQTFFGLDANAQTIGTDGSDGPITVVIQLSGGNDGLNTVIPLNGSDSRIYYDERPNLAIPEELVLPLAGQPDFGLHPALTNLQQLWQTGELAIVQGVGYPNPNLSHFKSFDFWHTAQPNTVASSGWLGRFFDHECSGSGDGCGQASGINISSTRNLAFAANDSNASIATENPPDFGWKSGGAPGSEPEIERVFRKMVGLDRRTRATSTEKEALAYVQRITHAALIGASTIGEALENLDGKTFPHAEFPNSSLGQALRHIASLILGGMQTSVYYADQTGYDTHSLQFTLDHNRHPLLGRHAHLLNELDEAVGAFASEMRAQGQWDRVLGFTFSEFGRKVIENGSHGTDHGAASCLFVFGGQVKGGMYGELPSLKEEDRIKNHGLEHHIDFRRVYRTVLQNWLGVPSSRVSDVLPTAPVDGKFDPVPFI
ncbi:MAG: DUF1501 domain-containing protein [Verrucomicrobiota bacterium]